MPSINTYFVGFLHANCKTLSKARSKMTYAGSSEIDLELSVITTNTTDSAPPLYSSDSEAPPSYISALDRREQEEEVGDEEEADEEQEREEQQQQQPHQHRQQEQNGNQNQSREQPSSSTASPTKRCCCCCSEACKEFWISVADFLIPVLCVFGLLGLATLLLWGGFVGIFSLLKDRDSRSLTTVSAHAVVVHGESCYHALLLFALQLLLIALVTMLFWLSSSIKPNQLFLISIHPILVYWLKLRHKSAYYRCLFIPILLSSNFGKVTIAHNFFQRRNGLHTFERPRIGRVQ